MVKLCARVGTYYLRGFPGGSGDKASACNAGNPASIPRSGRSTGEGNGNPLRYSWKIPVTEELGNPLRYSWKIPVTEEFGGLQSMESQSRTRLNDFTFSFHFHALEKEMATHFSVIAWKIPGKVEPGGLPSMGLHRVGHY